jgi:hypothetical protein
MNCLFLYLINTTISIARKMEPVPNRAFLLEHINRHNRINNSNIINNNIDYNIVLNRAERENIELIYNIYINHLNNNYIYNGGFQAAEAAAAVQAVVAIESVASASSTFERLNIDVEDHVVLSPSQASSQHCHGDGDGDVCCSICLNAEQEEEDKEEEEEEMVKTKCAHIFHSNCLAKWVIRKTTCPICRNSLTKKII